MLLNTETSANRVRADLKVVDQRPWHFEFFVDDTGTAGSDKYRAGVTFRHNNLFNLDHLLSMQYTTSPKDPSEISVVGLGYRIPLYSLGDSVDLFAAYSDVDSGQTTQGLADLEIRGKGVLAGIHYNWNLARRGSFQQRVSLGLDYRDFRDEATFAGTEVGNDIRLKPLSIS
ncbi:MAG: peptidase S37, partial [Desulfuromonas sp.]